MQFVFDLYGESEYFLSEEVGEKLPDYVDVGIRLD